MGNLLISDLNRVRKDKLLWILLVIAAGFAVLTPLLYWVIYSQMDPAMLEMMGIGTEAKGLFFLAFNIGNDLGYIAPILVAVILFKDFSHGTIRNKIIAGNRRTNIFFSTYFASLITLFAVTMFYALMTLGVSLLMFPYQNDPFGWKDLWFLLGSLALELNLYLYVAALVSYICVSSRNMGFVILKYLGVVMGVSLVTGIIAVAIGVMETMGDQEQILKILKFVQNINVYNYVNVIGKGSSYETKDLAYLIATPMVMTAGLLFLGERTLRKKDIK